MRYTIHLFLSSCCCLLAACDSKPAAPENGRDREAQIDAVAAAGAPAQPEPESSPTPAHATAVAPLDTPHLNRPMPAMAPSADEMAMHLYDFKISADKSVPSGVVQDIVFFDGDHHVPLCLGYNHGDSHFQLSELDLF